MKRALISLIWFYKRAISPYMPRACRFTPSCSDYAAQAIARYGALKGLRLSIWRVLRCNPFGKGGHDPVP
jgi:putative membrane protein insertion efficiency factor